MLDSTSLWMFVKKYERRLSSILLGALLFAAGWQTGRVMSPYYSSQPIVFQDRQCSACSSSGGSVSELQGLRDEGVALREEKDKPAVAGSSSQSRSEQFVASKNSNLFHHVSCPTVSQIKAANQVWYATVEEARGAGKTASSCAQRLGY
ncbi:MAG: hypothetical protein WD200_04380 [Candidatus Andersenbacteria bacterium]